MRSGSMKKKISICLTLLLATLLAVICSFKISFFTSTKKINETVFINQLQGDENFKLRLIYADSSMQEIQSFIHSPKGLVSTNEGLTAYTEGFLSKALHDGLLEAVNDYRAAKGLAPLHYFYQVKLIGDYAFAASSDGLDNLYWIHVATNNVQVPHLTSQAALEPQYVYHIQQVDSRYFILTAGVNSLMARLYTFSPSNLELRLVGTLQTDETAVSSSQYALDALGNALFTHTNGIEVLNASGTQHLNLSFTPQQLAFSQDITLAVRVENGMLFYALISPELELLDTGKLGLPHTDAALVSCFLQEDLLCTITYDATHPLYRHYISIYHLRTQTLIFCEGLSDYDDLALLKTELLH